MSAKHGDLQVEGQMSITDLFEPNDRLFAVSRIFARARKEMSLAEQKAFVYALSELKFTEEAKSNYVRLDKKTLAEILGIHSDPDHLSVDLFENIKDLPRHSFIEIREPDLDFYSSGMVISNIASFKNMVRVKFDDDYLGLFTGLSNNYLTMWSGDIFQMKSIRSVQIYELLRQETDTRNDVNDTVLGVKFLKDMFDIPKDGKGSYMTQDGHFARTHFEKYVLDPICSDLQKCKMINLLLQPNGKPYEKVKNGNRVDGYRLQWTFTEHPRVASAEEVKQIQERVDKNPQVLKVAKDILAGEKKTKKVSNANFEQRDYDWKELEKLLTSN